MIKFSLVCDKDHEFEGWFGSNAEFDDQQKKNFVSCPVCGSTNVFKALMAPSVAGTKKSTDENLPAAQVGMGNQLPAEMVEQLREIKQYVEKNSENVGDKFPEEARKIHYGETEARGIYGKASIEEAANLVDEGIGVVPIPDLPEDKN